MPNTNQILTRSRQSSFQTRAEADERILEGYFVVFNEPYHMYDDVDEIILPQAFENTDMRDVRALIDHKTHLVLGRTTANTLSVSVDDKGLFARVKVNSADTNALNLYARVQRGDVDQASFGFGDDEAKWITLANGKSVRQIVRIGKLFEVSVCTFPAYEQTSVAARSADADDVRREYGKILKNNIRRNFYNA